MPIDLDAAERFVLANARLLDRHRLAVLLHGAPAAPVLATLHAYRNPDGGFGHALEPDVRAPESEPASTLHALEVLLGIGAGEDPLVAGAARWIAAVAADDGGVPFVLPTAAEYPHAPWMVPSDGGSFLTFALAAALWQTPVREPWLEQGTDWCWAQLEDAEAPGGYWVKFALEFLDSVPDRERALAAIARLRPALGEDGSLPVPGGTENERITALTLSPGPGRRSRNLFAEEQIVHDLDELEREQLEDGGWTFDHLAWSPGQSVEWRGIVTLQALGTLLAHGRI
ncbi:MAG TPA: hypothetical protein VG294_19010 [Solirubrobacteraceae bacterium]|jgi:hypothetical protein|nr:hypothetical protein [Solirubrobacteraceae bacterium]